jgi:hypothetical protein
LRIEGEFTAEHEKYPKTDFVHFAGVSPLRYRELFARGRRKNSNGKFREWIKLPPRPNFDLKLPIWYTLEDYVANQIPTQLKSAVKKLKKMPFGTIHLDSEADDQAVAN